MKKRILCVMIAAILLVTMLPCSALAEESFFFVASNDTIPTTLTRFPISSGGILYVPYQVFDDSPCGVNSSYNTASSTFVLFTRDKRLVFNYVDNTVTDEEQVSNSSTAFFKKGILYLPLNVCTAHFGLKTSMLTSVGGYQVLRFTNGSEVYDDSLFLEKAENLIRYRVQQYSASEETTTAEPEKKPDETPKEDPEPEITPASIYLAFTNADTMRSASEALAEYGLRGSFFLTWEEMMEDPSLVRTLYVSGHTLGLAVEADCTDVEEALQGANEMLRELIGQKSLLALLPEGLDAPEGYCVFRIPTNARTVEEALEQTDAPSLLVCSSESANVLYRLRQKDVTPLSIRENTVIA